MRRLSRFSDPDALFELEDSCSEGQKNFKQDGNSSESLWESDRNGLEKGSPKAAPLSSAHGRGPWGGGKTWLDLSCSRTLAKNACSKDRLLVARAAWANTRMLRAPVQGAFFSCSYRYRGHEGCVNAIK